MDNPEIRTLHPRDVLRQLADSMNCKHNELSVTIPVHTTWRSAIQAVEAALGDVDEDFLLMPPGNWQSPSNAVKTQDIPSYEGGK
ncbi:hypothetical protein N7491_005814 [Penicillium cf. griseofulvum]|nr:hypothetical protein N7491_005814 [Penicillium cf. griseofulvum]